MMFGEGKLEKNPHIWAQRFDTTPICQPVGVGFLCTDFGEEIMRDGFYFQCPVERRYVAPNLSPGSLEVDWERRGYLPSNLFRTFRAFRGNKFHFSSGFYAVVFDAIFILCTLVSHVTGTFRGVAHCYLSLQGGIKTPR